MNRIARPFVLCLCLLSAACAEPMADHQPSAATVQLLRNSDMASLQVGPFTADPSVSDKGVGIRASRLVSPDNGSFAQYLQKTLEADLRAAGKLDANAELSVTGILTESTVSTPIDMGTATLAANFRLIRQGKLIFEKRLSVHATWDSSFLGAIAIPESINQYTELYHKLVAALLTDPDFRAAAKKA